jgi:hypothetical protein
MIDGSDNNDISVTISTSQIVPEAVAEFQVPDQRLQRRVRPQQRRAGQRHHQVGHQPLPRRRLGLLHGERLLLADEHREGAGLEKPPALQPAPGRLQPRRADRQATRRSSSASTSTTDQRPTRRRRHGAHADAGRLRGAAERAAARRQPASSRQAVLQRSRSCRTSTRRTRVPQPALTTLVNGVPIETARPTSARSQPEHVPLPSWGG